MVMFKFIQRLFGKKVCTPLTFSEQLDKEYISKIKW